jgi:hypothetical protein
MGKLQYNEESSSVFSDSESKTKTEKNHCN